MKYLTCEERFKNYSNRDIIEQLAHCENWEHLTAYLQIGTIEGLSNSQFIDTYHHVKYYFLDKIEQFLHGNGTDYHCLDIEFFINNAPEWILEKFEEQIEEEKEELIAGSTCDHCHGEGCDNCDNTGHPRWEDLINE